jgi:hypothetical protein
VRRILSWLTWVPVAVVVVALSIANRAPVRFSLDPFSREDPWYAVDVPLFALLLGSLFVGLLFGGAGAWFNQGKWRKATRRARAEAVGFRQEAQRLRRERERERGDEALIPHSNV